MKRVLPSRALPFLNFLAAPDVVNNIQPLLKVFEKDGIKEEVGFDILSLEQFVIVSSLKAGKYDYEETAPDWYLSGISSSSSIAPKSSKYSFTFAAISGTFL